MPSQTRVHKGLDRAYRQAGAPIALDPARDRYVIFSDHHKGMGDGADDFVKSKVAYHTALQHYLAEGYTLLALGDVEELWECRARDVIPRYQDTLALEAQFHARGKYIRFFGNHDDQWEKQGSFERHLGGVFPGLRIREGLIFSFAGGGRATELVLLHGHQGTISSDTMRWISKPVVRYLWRPFQRLTRKRLNTPATDFTLRGEHSVAMFTWAKARGRILVAGHTHKPVFLWGSEVARLEARLAQLEAEVPRNEPAITEDRAALTWVRQLEQAEIAATGAPPQPCYFNTGCCSFDDGDVTGIEIADEEIRLVRWPDDDGSPRKKMLRSAKLTEVVSRLTHG